MVGKIGTIIIILLSLAHFYLKCGVMTSFVTMISAVFGLIISFNFYEILADQLISRGYGGQWVQPGCFLLIFVIGFAVLRSGADILVGSNVNFPKTATAVTAVICGFITGLIISGMLLISLGLSPLDARIPYTRFSSPVSLSGLNSPNKAMLNSDGFVTGLFGWLSRGVLKSDSSFSVYHADFINQIHLNRLMASKDVYGICAKNSVIVPDKPQNGVRIREIDGRNMIVVRIGIIARDIADGGAKSSNGEISFNLGQIRLLCKDKTTPEDSTGSASVLYPSGYISDNRFVRKSLDDVISASKDDYKKRTAWFDIVFDVPDDKAPILLQFKQNAITRLPKPVFSTDEIEQRLNAEEPEGATTEEQTPAASG